MRTPVRTGPGRAPQRAEPTIRPATRVSVVPVSVKRLAGKRNKTSAAAWQAWPSGVGAMQPIAR